MNPSDSQKTILFTVLLGMSFLHAENTVSISKQIERFSKNEGYEIAKDLKDSIEWIDLPLVIQGMQDYINEKPLQDEIKPGEEHDFCRIAIQLLKEESDKNLEKANSFLNSLSNNGIFHSLEGGKVMYEVVAEGVDSPIVNKESSPLLQYVISTLDGLEVVDTRKMALSPFRVSLSEAIPGFALGLVGMHIGERRRLFIHPDLGYGIQGWVPPNSLLVADVEVVGF